MLWDRLGDSTGWGRERPAGGGVNTWFFPILNTEKGGRIEVVRGSWAEGHQGPGAGNRECSWF
ncbi:unnamed protein product [Gulo gulo]|uniref:Uncharacterized protein n=1 Tax=Gulo gulo TaxID=48420 RepID=A0A9X9M0C8_GULGU|nr:unnamed protein product [Gulo gulo]